MSQTQTRTDSVDGREHDEVQKKVKSRRPASKLTAFTRPKTRYMGISSSVQCLMGNLRLYRYCIPAAATESVAVSGLRAATRPTPDH